MPLHIVSSESSGVPGPAPAARAKRLHPAHPRAASITIVVVLLALGCGGETPSPTDPSSTRALATAATALAFSQLSGGGEHTCGLTTDFRAYCWGYNHYGQLGDGTTTQHPTPTAVLGGHEFRQVTAGDWHTCGVTTSNQAYCWGQDDVGQLGNDPEKRTRLRPALVAGGYQFRQLDAGSYHTCAVTTDNRAFCWGRGSDGQIGDGKTIARFTPRAVAGGLSFTRVSGGVFHTCGETTNNLAYCWGNNAFGQLGSGGPAGTDQLKPVAVAGGLQFGEVSAGADHTCGKTLAAVAYCWGLQLLRPTG